MDRIGIFGGTYNPPHLGHVQAAVYGKNALKLDKLYLIPSHISPHKVLPDGSPTPQQRLEMVRLAACDTDLVVSDIELSRGGASYTYQTVLSLREIHPDSQIYLMMGTDMFLTLDSWREAELLLSMVIPVVFYRGDKAERERVEEKKAEFASKGVSAIVMENPVTEISSTQLRRMLVFGCAAPFLSEEVHTYILQNRLYGTGESYIGLPMDKLEKVVTSLVNPNRIAHILGCRDTAVALAKRWGADETDAARAGLLHDITKALDGPLQLTVCQEYGMVLDDFSRENPKTLHAYTGAMVAERIFGENPAVVSAIHSHTTGKAGMNILEKIIYVADYMEPNRKFPGVEELRQAAFSDIDRAMEMGLEMTLDLLKKEGKVISVASQEALCDIKRHLERR
ncbi:MAG: nicotinate (nicotinamide) nucleotide adenylyltransferase [Ruminococcaceae bacterium]|nr:nicotinate (nicotinamide) nucleotide adenylyltransferase [Oscillospiraceae bacterium]